MQNLTSLGYRSAGSCEALKDPIAEIEKAGLNIHIWKAGYPKLLMRENKNEKKNRKISFNSRCQPIDDHYLGGLLFFTN